MENQEPFQTRPAFQQNPIPLPNATAVLVLGIISILGCFCYGLGGLICGIISLVLAGKDSKLYNEDPSRYTAGSYSNLRSGKICAIIGLSMSIIYVIIVIFVIATVGLAALSNPQHFMDSFR